MASEKQIDYLRGINAKCPQILSVASRATGVEGRSVESLSNGEASKLIQAYEGSCAPYRPSSARGVITATLRAFDGDKSKAFAALRSKVGNALVFSKNVDGNRVPKPLDEQKAAFTQTFESVCKEILPLADDPFRGQSVPTGMGEALDSYGGDVPSNGLEFKPNGDQGEGSEGQGQGEGSDGSGDSSDSDFAGSEDSGDSEGSEGDSEGSDESDGSEGSEGKESGSEGSEDGKSEGNDDPNCEDPDASNDDESLPKPPKNHRWMTKREFLAKVRECRRYAADRLIGGAPLDDVGLRPVEYGGKMRARGGIPYEFCLDAFTMHWPKDARDAVGIREWDPARFFPPIKGEPKMSGYVVRLAKSGVPIMLIGGKGTGKSTLCKIIAKHLGVDFGMVPMTAGASTSWLTGRVTLQGFLESHFCKIYEGGGVFLFDEIDAADPNMLLTVNDALAAQPGDFFYNANAQKAYERHAEFVPMAAANTMGLGQNRQYTGRERMDAATMDRFACGRVRVGLDESLEERILFSL